MSKVWRFLKEHWYMLLMTGWLIQTAEFTKTPHDGWFRFTLVCIIIYWSAALVGWAMDFALELYKNKLMFELNYRLEKRDSVDASKQRTKTISVTIGKNS